MKEERRMFGVKRGTNLRHSLTGVAASVAGKKRRRREETFKLGLGRGSLLRSVMNESRKEKK